jgi:hypothetical protein
VLLVDADQAEPADGREDGGASSDHDPRLTAFDALSLVAALGFSEGGVEKRNAIAEASPEAAQSLRGQRNLGHEDDRTPTTLQRGRAGLEVHLRLAAPGRAVQQERRGGASVEGRFDPPDRGALRVREPERRRFPGERLPWDRRRAFAASRSAPGGNEG